MQPLVTVMLILCLLPFKVWSAVKPNGQSTFVVWQPSAGHPRYLIPKRIDEDPIQAVRAYLLSQIGTADLLSYTQPLVLAAQGFGQPLSEAGNTTSGFSNTLQTLGENQDRVLFVANSRRDHETAAPRAIPFMAQLRQTENYLLPVGALLRFSPEERKKLYGEIAAQFSGLVAMGGDDVTPELYQQKATYARNFNATRDRLEIELIQHFVAAEKGFFFAVCRGHQIASVALGYQLVQDVGIQLRPTTPHEDFDHPVHLLGTQSTILSRFPGVQSTFTAYSWHHQAVAYQPGGFLKLAAVSPEGDTEALEFRNGKGLTVQFHPELRSTGASQTILAGVMQEIRRFIPRLACHRVHASSPIK